jgi:anti-sigma B factor antagonist
MIASLMMPNFEIQVSERANGARLLTLEGPLTLQNIFDFQNVVRKDHTDVIIDLAGVPYMDSAGLGAILGAFASSQRTNHKFALVNVPDRLKTMFQVAHVDTLLPIFGNVEAAEEQKANA